MPNKLEQLRAMSTVVADTGDMDSIRAFKPTDATTNPSLILKASQMPAYARLVEEAIVWGRRQGAAVGDVTDRVAVNFGDRAHQDRPRPRVDRGRRRPVVRHRGSRRQGEEADRALRGARDRPRPHPDQGRLDLGGRWRRSRRLQAEGIDCNMTLIFSLAQAIAAADAKALPRLAVRRPHPRLARQGGRRALYDSETDPGVQSVRAIYAYYKTYGDQDGRHGRLVPQHRRDRGAGRLRPPDHLAAAAGGAVEGRGRTPAPPRSRITPASRRRASRWTRSASAGC